MRQDIVQIIADSIGWLGALLFLISYGLLTFRKWKSESALFQWFNFAGGVLLGISTLYDASYPAAFINFAWALIAVYGLSTRSAAGKPA